jgi:ligand-binding sensor domain-containing protein/signal transduction histidine kinase
MAPAAWPAGAPAAPAAVVDPIDLARLPSRVFTDRDGLPQNSILSMTLDASGRLWAGTLDGAASYDGRRWTAVDMPRRTVSNQVNAVLGAADGSVWFGTNGGGLARLRDGAWQTYDTAAGLPGNAVKVLRETRQGGRTTLWAGTDRGLARLEDGRWSTVDARSGLPHDSVLSLLPTVADDGGLVLWVGTGGGLARLEAGRWTTVDPAALPHPVVLSLMETAAADGTRTLWAGTSNGLARLDRGRWTTFGAGAGLPALRIEALAETGAPGARVVWAACFGGGLARWDGADRWVTFGDRSGLPNTRLRSLMETTAPDGHSLLWVGTAAGGLARLKPDGWRVLDTTNGLPSNIVRSLLEARDASGARVLWIGTAGGGLARAEGGRWTTFDAAAGLASPQVMALARTAGKDGASTIWIGTEGAGLLRFEGGRLRTDPPAPGFTPETVNALLATANAAGESVLWVGTGSGTHLKGSGLGRLERGRWTVFTTAEGLPHDSVNALAETEGPGGARVLWVGTPAGLARGQDGAWTVYDRRAGLPNDHVRSVAEVGDGAGGRRLFVGTLGGGVAYADVSRGTPVWTTLSDATTPALPNNVIYQVRGDRFDRVYLFTNKGVARLTPRRAGQGPAYEVDRFDRDDGIPSQEFNSGASMVDSAGRIWAGSVQGAVVLDPSPERERPRAVLSVRGTVPALGRALASGEALPSDANGLEFDFPLVSLFREAETRYRTELVGLEASATDWGPEAHVPYARLPPGAFVFRAWARDFRGTVSGPVEVPFSVRAPFWRTWPALVLYLAAALALAAQAARLRTRVLARRNAALQALVRQRTAELDQKVEELRVSEHRALAASDAKSVFIANMSHELKTPLNAVLGFAQLMDRRKERDAEDREHLGAIRRSGEQLLGLINDILSLSAGDSATSRVGGAGGPARDPGTAAVPLTAERLRALPAPWVARLREAVDHGDPIEAAELTQEIEGLDAPLAAEIRARLLAYRLEELEAALDRLGDPPPAARAAEG